jgi:hypothetical protein
LDNIQATGDSDLLMLWDFGTYRIENVALILIMVMVKDVTTQIVDIYFKQIFRETEFLFDELSKEDQFLWEGWIIK